MNYNSVVSKVAALCGLLLLLVGISYVPDVLGGMNLADRLSAAVSVSTTEYPFQDANIAVTKPQKLIWVRPATSADGCADQYCSTAETRDSRTWQNGRYTFTVLNKGDEIVELFYKKTNTGFAKGSGNNGLIILRTDVPALIKYKTTISKASAGMGWTTLKDSPDSNAVEYSYIHTNERVVLAPGEKTTINYEYEVDLKNAMPNKAYYLAISGLAYGTEREGELSTPRENILDFKQNLASGWSPWVMQPSISPGNGPLQDSGTYLEITDVKPLVDKSGLEVSYRFSDPTGKIKAKGSPLITFNGEDHGTGTVFNPVDKAGIRLDLVNASSTGKQVILWYQIGLPTVTPDKANKKVVIRWGGDDIISVWDKSLGFPYFNTSFDARVIDLTSKELSGSIYTLGQKDSIPDLSALDGCYFYSPHVSGFKGTLDKFTATVSDSVTTKNAFSLRADCVANKSNPSQSIPFSTEMIVTYTEKPTIEITQPSIPEIWYFGQTKDIYWKSTGLTAGTIQVHLWIPGEVNSTCFIKEVPYSETKTSFVLERNYKCGDIKPGKYKVIVSADNGNNDHLKTSAVDYSEEIDFIALNVIQPNGGEKLTLESQYGILAEWPEGTNIERGFGLYKDKVYLGYLESNFSGQKDVSGSDTSPNLLFPWKVGDYVDPITRQKKTAPAGDGYRVRMYSVRAPSLDESDQPFSLVAPNVSIEPSLVSTSESKMQEDDGSSMGTFKIGFKVKAVGGDVYLSKYAGDLSSNPVDKNTFQTVIENVPLQSDNGIVNVLAARPSNNVSELEDTFKILSGQTGEFELTVSVATEMTGKSGLYLVGIKGLSFGSSEAGERQIYPVLYKTKYLFLTAPTVNTTTTNTNTTTNDPCGPGGRYEGTRRCR